MSIENKSQTPIPKPTEKVLDSHPVCILCNERIVSDKHEHKCNLRVQKKSVIRVASI
jgi:hypothetical protein